MNLPTAHLHHAWDTYNRYGRTPSALRIAMVQTCQFSRDHPIRSATHKCTVFQLAYTSLFGFHCAYLLLRTGSLIPPTISHIFCNVMGLPQYGLHVRMFPKRRIGKQSIYLSLSISADGDRSACLRSFALAKSRTTAIQAMYLLGIAGYAYTMRWWTQADDSLFWPAPGQPARF